MRLVGEIPLVQFLHHFEFCAGPEFRILILALIRDADAPNFYSDVERYWTSLDDVTGDYALFAVAAENVADYFYYRSALPENRADGSHHAYSSSLAIAPSSGRSNPTKNLPPDAVRAPGPEANIRNANTSQVSELRNALNLSEADIPCLHLTLYLNPRQKKSIVLRLRDMPEFSIYTACKDIMTRLSPLLIPTRHLSEPREPSKGVFFRERQEEISSGLRFATNEKLAAEQALRHFIAAYQVKSELAEILPRVRELPRDQEEDSRRNKLLDGLVARCTDLKRKKKWADQDRQRVIAGERMTNIISREEADLLNKLIGLSFSKPILSILLDDIAGITEEQRRLQIEQTVQEAGRNLKKEQERVHQLTDRLMPEWQSAFEQIRLEYNRRLANYVSELRNQEDVEAMLRREFEALANITRSSGERRWDYFISYPRNAREVAVAIFRAIERIGRVFMDYFCIVVGQHWDRTIAEVQDNSDATIVIITTETPHAHFQESEIHRAINLHRTKSHRIIPIYADPAIRPPFGLEQIHGIMLPADSSSERCARLVVDHLSQ